jgi:hypothetical protein
VGKIPKETTEEDIGSMFAAMNLDCTNVVVLPRFPSPPSRHFHLSSTRPSRSFGIKTPKMQETPSPPSARAKIL